MISEKTKAAINEATSISEKDELETPKSDTQIVYGPLLKYGVVAIVMVSFIVTSAIVIEKQMNNIDNVVALIDTDTVVITNTETTTETQDRQPSETIAIKQIVETRIDNAKPSSTKTAGVTAAKVDENSIKETNAKQETIDKEIVTASVVELTPATATIDKVLITATERKSSSSSMMLAQHRGIMLKNDQRILERVKLNHEKYIEILRQQSGKQNNYHEHNIIRLESNYLKQVAAIKRSQDLRIAMTNRI